MNKRSYTKRPPAVGANPEWMTTHEAAAYLGVTTRTLYRQIDEDRIPAYRFGRVIRLQKPDLDAFIAASRIQPGDLEHLYPEPAAREDEE